MTRVVAPYDCFCDECNRPIRRYTFCFEEEAEPDGYGRTRYWVTCLACGGTDAERDDLSLYDTVDAIPEMDPDFKPELCPPYSGV